MELLSFLKFINFNPLIATTLNKEKIIKEIDSLLLTNDLNCTYEYCKFLINISQYDKVSEILYKLIDSYSDDFNLYYLLSLTYYLNNNIREAQYPLIKCLELNPEFTEGRFLLGRILFKANQFEKALKIFEIFEEDINYLLKAKLYISKIYYYGYSLEKSINYIENNLLNINKSNKINDLVCFLPAIYAYQMAMYEKYDIAFAILQNYIEQYKDKNLNFYFILELINAFLFSYASSETNNKGYLSYAELILKTSKEFENTYSFNHIYLFYKNLAYLFYYHKIEEYNKTDLYIKTLNELYKISDTEDYLIFNIDEINNKVIVTKSKKSNYETNFYCELGKLHIENNNFESAITCFKKASTLTPNDISILFMLSESYILKGNLEEALKIYEKIKLIDPNNVEAYRKSSEIYLAINNYEKFILECQHILTIEPDDPISRFYVGEYFFKNNSIKEATEFLKYVNLQIENMLKNTPIDSLPIIYKEIYEKSCLLLAQIAYKNDNKEETILYLNLVININPENIKAFELLSKLKQNQQDKQIMLILREATNKEKQNDYNNAILLYEQAIELDPHFVDVHYLLAKVLLKTKNYPRVIFECERVIELSNKSFNKLFEVYLMITIASYESNKFDKCFESLIELIEISNEPLINLMLANLCKINFLLNGNLKNVNLVIDKLIKQKNISNDNINNVIFAYQIANIPTSILEQQNLFEEAKKLVYDAYQKDSKDIYSMYLYAYLLEKSDEPENAYQIFSKIANINYSNEKENELTHTTLKYLTLKNYNLNFEIKNCLLIKDLNVLNLINKSILKLAYYEELNSNFKNAIYYYERAYNIEKNNPFIIMKIIDLMLNEALSDTNSKVAKVSALIKNFKSELNNSSNAELKFKLGYLYFKLPDELSVLGSTLENVIMELKHCLAIDKTYIPAYSALRLAYQKMGTKDKKMYTQAVDIIKKAIEIIGDDNPYLNFELGEAYYYYYNVDYKNEALECYKKAIQHKPDFVEAHFKIASIYRIKKEYDKAFLHYMIAYDLEPNGLYANECKKSMNTLKRRHLIE